MSDKTSQSQFFELLHAQNATFKIFSQIQKVMVTQFLDGFSWQPNFSHKTLYISKVHESKSSDLKEKIATKLGPDEEVQ